MTLDEIDRAKQADELRAAIEIEMRIAQGRWRRRMVSPRLGRLEQQGLIAHLLTGLRDGAVPFLNPDSAHFRKWYKSALLDIAPELTLMLWEETTQAPVMVLTQTTLPYGDEPVFRDGEELDEWVYRGFLHDKIKSLAKATIEQVAAELAIPETREEPQATRDLLHTALEEMARAEKIRRQMRDLFGIENPEHPWKGVDARECLEAEPLAVRLQLAEPAPAQASATGRSADPLARPDATSPESAAVEIGQPDAGASESRPTEQRQNPAIANWKRLRECGIKFREEILRRIQESWNPLGFVLGRTAQQILATDCANAAAELAEATFLECAKWMYAETSSEDEAIFEHTVNQMVEGLPMQAADLWRAVTANVSLEEDPFPLYGQREDYEEYEDSSPADLVFRKGYREINALAVRALAKDKIGIIAQKIIVDRLRGRIKIDMPFSAFHYEERDEAKFAEGLAEAIRVDREGVAAPAAERAEESSPESKGQEIEHPKADGSGKTAAAKEYEVAESLYEHREREGKPQWKRYRTREIPMREQILEWSSEGRPISTARQAKIVDWLTDAFAELSEADFVDWSREEADDVAFEERIRQAVGCCHTFEVAYLWWRLIDMVDLAEPEYLAPKVARARSFQPYEKQRAVEDNYHFEVESAIREIAEDKLRVVAQRVTLRRFKGEIPYEPTADSIEAKATPHDLADPFLTKEQRTAARVKAQGTGSVVALATKLGVDRTQLNRWENHHLNGKSIDTCNRIETGIVKILATLK